LSPAPRHEVLDAGQRLRRLLVILAHLSEVGSASLVALAQRFSMEEDELVAELELAACCGLPPYTPDQLLELVVDGDRVFAFGLDALRRPPRLTPDEGFALAAVTRALLSVPGASLEGPLGRALTKLEAALGEDRIQIEMEQPEWLPALRRAAAAGECVEIEYLGVTRGERTTRVVEPFAVAAREGHFYLDAYCHLANDWRRFLVSRVAALRPTGAPVEPRTLPVALTGPRAFAGGEGVQVATVEVDAALAWALERVASGPAEDTGEGRVRFEVPVGDRGWLGRLLLQLGDAARVIDPPELVDAAREVALATLRRYR
jgi:proteasome accessory factor C